MVIGYIKPSSVDECIKYLDEYKQEARILAGGTDLILQQKEKRPSPSYWIDISGITGIDLIEERQDRLYLGAGVTHAQVACSSLIKDKAPLLSKASGSVGSPQIRNIATIAGNLINAQPAADAAIALIALDAEVDIVSPKGKTTKPVKDLYAGLGKSIVDSTYEMVTTIHFKCLEKNQGSSFVRISPRNSLSLPVLNVAMVITIKDHIIKDIRIVLGPVSEQPFRARDVEESLIGVELAEQERINDLLEYVSMVCNPRDSLIRGSCAYRLELAKVMIKRAYHEALGNILII
jgi:CO/xanthine dehydrogenase FAD-binding subunit